MSCALSKKLTLVLAFCLGGASAAAAAPVTEIHYVMGTYFSITTDDLVESQARPLMRSCFNEARRLEAIFSRYDASSELSRLNARRERGPTRVGPELADLLERSLRLQTATAGRFDVTIGALTENSDMARMTAQTRPERRRMPALPGQEERARLITDRRVTIAPGVQLDFDGIAKGYTVDRCVALLRRAGVRRALLSLGESSQYALGAPLGAAAWLLAVRDLSGHRALGTLALHDQALSVSSAFTPGGHIAHIIDPRSGQRVGEPSIAVVVMESATDAEAWSKALLIERSAITAQPDDSPAALRITRRGIERIGRIPFTAYESPRQIEPDAEPFL